MKAEITQNKKAFEPIEVKITIDSLEELAELCFRLQLGIGALNSYPHTRRYGRVEKYHFNKLWCELHKIHKERK